MSIAVYSEINFHITWHTKGSLPMITERIESRLYQYLTHRILETPGARLHALVGIETHIHIAASLAAQYPRFRLDRTSSKVRVSKADADWAVITTRKLIGNTWRTWRKRGKTLEQMTTH